MTLGLAIVLPTASSAEAFAKVLASKLMPQIDSLRSEFMANIDAVKAAIATERQQVQAKLKDLSDQITALQGQVLTAENVTELTAAIDQISEPEPASPAA